LPTKIEEPHSIVKLGYDSEGQLTSRTDGNEHVWEYPRDKLEQVTEEKTPLGKVTKRKYEKAGNVESVEDPEKKVTEFTYDESNRIKKIKYSTGRDPVGAELHVKEGGGLRAPGSRRQTARASAGVPAVAREHRDRRGVMYTAGNGAYRTLSRELEPAPGPCAPAVPIGCLLAYVPSAQYLRGLHRASIRSPYRYSYASRRPYARA
jgi:YD repeat-containing protein